MRHPKTPDEHTVRPEVMARMCGITVPMRDRAYSWDDLMTEVGDAYETAKRLRQQGGTAA